jgi:hypothetical protein
VRRIFPHRALKTCTASRQGREPLNGDSYDVTSDSGTEFVRRFDDLSCLIGREVGRSYVVIIGQVKRGEHLLPFRFQTLMMAFQIIGLFLLLKQGNKC